MTTSFDDNQGTTETTIDVPLAPSVRNDDLTMWLETFLSRPVIVGTLSWSALILAAQNLSPLGLVLNDPTISDKLRYFQNMRFTLVVRLSTSTTAHHYGLLGVSLVPYGLGTTAYGRSSTDYYTLMDANTSDAVTLRYPFLYYFSAYQIASNGTIPDDYAVLWLDTLQPIMRDDGVAAGTPPITVTAWLEDVSLMDPTPYTAYSGGGAGRPPPMLAPLPNKDFTAKLAGMSAKPSKPPGLKKPTVEVAPRKKPVHEGSAPSGAVSGAMSQLSTIMSAYKAFPGIGNYAHAAEIGLGAAANIAKIFGFSRPVASMEPSYMISRPMSNLSSGVGADSVIKLTLDPENQLAVSGSQFNTIDDPLALLSLTKRWGYFDYITWSTTDVVDTVKAILPVTPAIGSVVGTGFVLPPVSLPTMFFRAWSGSLEYRFVISATPFHRGKLLFYYSPGIAYSSVVATSALQRAQCCVLDVASATEASIVVGWSSQQNVLLIADDDHNPTVYITNLSTAPGTDCNGSIHVQVLEPLIATSASASLTISVFVRGGDDLWYGIPNYVNLSAYNALSGSPVGRVFDGRGVTDQEVIHCSFGGSIRQTHAIGDVVGETTVSLRSLLKRYAPTLVLVPSSTYSTEAYLSTLATTFPLYPMCASVTTTQFWAADSPNSGVCLVPNSPHGLVARCFQGTRGGYRHKVLDTNAVSNSATGFGAATPSITVASLMSQADSGNTPTVRYSVVAAPTAGMTVTPQFLTGMLASGGDLQSNTNGVIAQIEAPAAYVRNYATPRQSNDPSTYGPHGFRLAQTRSNWTTTPVWTVLSAAAEDTNFIFWLGCPILATSPTTNPVLLGSLMP